MNITKVKQKSVNSKRLFNKINEEIQDAFDIMVHVKWENQAARSEFCEGVEQFLSQFVEQGEITHPKIVCDNRNNRSFMSAKTIVFEVHYKQPHCLNTTIIEYHISL